LLLFFLLFGNLGLPLFFLHSLLLCLVLSLLCCSCFICFWFLFLNFRWTLRTSIIFLIVVVAFTLIYLHLKLLRLFVTIIIRIIKHYLIVVNIFLFTFQLVFFVLTLWNVNIARLIWILNFFISFFTSSTCKLVISI